MCVRIGPAGWSYPDWAGYVYPARRPAGFHEAAYLAAYFDTIEINTSFYQPIRPEHAAQWVSRVAHNPRFLFTAKLWQKFTHEPTASVEDERAVRAGFDELRRADKLGFNAGFCNIDQPVIGRSLEPSEEVTSPISYVRLHGRRYDTWFNDDPAVPGYERYNYLYRQEELEPWASRIRKVTERARDVFVVTNNHYQGKAVVNALQLISLLKGEKVKVPEPLRQHYPQLDEIASEAPAEPTLFPLGPASEPKSS